MHVLDYRNIFDNPLEEYSYEHIGTYFMHMYASSIYQELCLSLSQNVCELFRYSKQNRGSRYKVQNNPVYWLVARRGHCRSLRWLAGSALARCQRSMVRLDLRTVPVLCLMFVITTRSFKGLADFKKTIAVSLTQVALNKARHGVKKEERIE